ASFGAPTPRRRRRSRTSGSTARRGTAGPSAARSSRRRSRRSSGAAPRRRSGGARTLPSCSGERSWVHRNRDARLFANDAHALGRNRELPFAERGALGARPLEGPASSAPRRWEREAMGPLAAVKDEEEGVVASAPPGKIGIDRATVEQEAER